MANVSLAYGKLTVMKHDSKADINLVRKMFLKTEDFYYGNLSSVGEDIKDFDKEVSFGTDGRWMFIRNIEQFFEGISDTDLTDEDLKQLDGLMILFDYSDFEPGEEYLVSAKVLIGAEYNGNYLETIIVEEDIKEFDVNAQNLTRLGVFSEIFDSYTDYGIDVLKENLARMIDNERIGNKEHLELAKKIVNKNTKELLKKFEELDIFEYDDASSFEINNFLSDHYNELKDI